MYRNVYPDAPELLSVLYAQDGSPDNRFGFSLSIFRAGVSANFGYALGVGAPGANLAYVFTNNMIVDEWTQNSRLVSPYSSPSDTPALFGHSISVNENIVMVGSPGVGKNAGRAVSFIAVNRSSGDLKLQWSQQSVVRNVSFSDFEVS